MKRRLQIIAALIAVAFVGLCTVPTVVWPLLTGWVTFLARVGPRLTADWLQVALGAAALALFTLGVHFTARWLRGHDWPVRSTLAVVLAVLVLFASGTAMVGIVHQSTWLATREPSWYQRVPHAAHRMRSFNNLKQIGLGIHNYHDAHRSLPLGGTYTPTGEAMHGWQTAILPYLSVSTNGVDLGAAWHDEPNGRLLRSPIETYLNPALRDGPYEDANGFALSHYAANRHVMGYNQRYKGKLEGDAAQTLLVGEVNANFQPWASPRNVRDPLLGINASPAGFGGPPMQGGANFALLDGSVRMIRDDIDPAVLEAITKPAADKPREW